LWPGLGRRFDPGLNLLSNVSLVAIVGLTFVVNLPAIMSVSGTSALPAAVFLLVGAFVIGYVFGIFGRDARRELGLNTAQRNYAAALVVANQTLHNPDVLVMVV